MKNFTAILRKYTVAMVMNFAGLVFAFTAFMALIMIISAGFVWNKFAMGHTDMGMMLTSIGGIVGFITALYAVSEPITKALAISLIRKLSG